MAKSKVVFTKDNEYYTPKEFVSCNETTGYLRNRVY